VGRLLILTAEIPETRRKVKSFSVFWGDKLLNFQSSVSPYLFVCVGGVGSPEGYPAPNTAVPSHEDATSVQT
jgi:hypothetical protein